VARIFLMTASTSVKLAEIRTREEFGIRQSHLLTDIGCDELIVSRDNLQ
jgi:hypothetical protein